MGFLRFFLALAVVNTHAGLLPFSLFPADAAVQIFYMISGFYMAMVLNEKYLPEKSTYGGFILSRVLRLGPAYMVTLALTLIVGFCGLAFFHYDLPPVRAWLSLFDSGGTHGFPFVLPQLLLVGLDLFNFIRIDPDSSIHFSSNFRSDVFPAWHTVFVPQAWTLAVEFYFYLLAPFLVRRAASSVMLLILASFALRVLFALTFSFRLDPWSYRFFPFELLFFLSGALSYRLAMREKQVPKALYKALTAGAIIAAGILCRAGIDGRIFFLSPFVMALVFLFLDRIFSLTQHNEIDRYIGELSYPVYVIHMLVIWTVDMIHFDSLLIRNLAIASVTLLAAVILSRTIETSVGMYRRQLAVAGTTHD